MIEFKRPQYIVCENAGTVTVSVERYGALNDTSFVDIRAKEMSAKEADDYVPSAVTQLQFEPGKNTNHISQNKYNFMLAVHLLLYYAGYEDHHYDLIYLIFSTSP